MRHCKHCGEPEKTKGEDPKGGDFGWFDASEGLDLSELRENEPATECPQKRTKEKSNCAKIVVDS
jgi:hypothetical protein